MRLPIKNYEGLYEVDNEGSVFSLDRIVIVKMKYGFRQQKVPAMKRALSKHSSGYLTIRLADNGKVNTYRVHRLVAEAFIPNPENKPYVNHKDLNKHNNCLENLEWSTEQENTDHYLLSAGTSITGFNHQSSKFSEDTVKLWIKKLEEKVMIKDIAEEYNCSRSTVTRLVNRVKNRKLIPNESCNEYKGNK